MTTPTEIQPRSETDRPQPTARRRRGPLRSVLLGLGGVLAVYLVIRGVAEFFVIDYGNAASYRHDWGGPSLPGVFAVHTGPAVVIVAGALAYWRRRRSA